jgi:hypothetical protein
MEDGRLKDWPPDKGFFSRGFLLILAGLLFPNEPLNIFPFFVFLSPLPISVEFANQYDWMKSGPNRSRLNTKGSGTD